MYARKTRATFRTVLVAVADVGGGGNIYTRVQNIDPKTRETLSIAAGISTDNFFDVRAIP